jgi:hypothetical protein
MKKILLISTIAISLSLCYGTYFKRTPYTIVKEEFGIILSKKFIIKNFIDEWASNGDGECSFEMNTIDNAIIQEAEEQSKHLNFKILPISEEDMNKQKPIHFFSFYDAKIDNQGTYKFEVNPEDYRDYKLIMIDTKKNKIIVKMEVY